MSLKLENIKVKIGKNEIIHNLNLDVDSGKFISILGPSGCGKSTLLKSIAGLNELENGKIILFDEEIQNLAPQRRGTVIVFQDLRLFPHLSVEKNIAFYMNLKKVDKKISKEIVSKLLKDVKLEGFENRKIKALSGGQMQRVALARALASNPKILLLDEPFSGLDEKLRLEMGELVKKLQRENNLTMILVTHDKNEALQLSDKIAIMMDGEIIQYDTPLDLYTKPNSKKVADYFGKNNYFLGNVKNNVFKCEYFDFEKDIADGKYEIMVRPSHIYIDNQKDDFLIEDISYLGDFVKIKLSNNIVANVRYSLLEKYNLKVGNKVGIKIKEATFF